MRGTFSGIGIVLAILATAVPANGDVFDVETQGGEALVDASVETVRLTVDFARILILERPASTIVIGNTGIADANMSDDSTIVLTGKTAGTTNLIVLDESRRAISNLVLEVVIADPHLVRVHDQGGRRQTFTCARRCEPILSVGDEPGHFSAVQGQISARQGFANVVGTTP
jgi:hypothetical protein